MSKITLTPSRLKLTITSFKKGSKRKDPSETLKDIWWTNYLTEKKVGGISKHSYGGDWQEYRVYYIRPEYKVTARARSHNQRPHEHPLTPSPNTQDSYVLMECFDDLSLANAYVKKHFASAETLKKEMFNVYVKLLQPLG